VSRPLVLVALVLVSLGMAPVAGAKDVGAEAQIREAYARVFDRSIPLGERLTHLEDGEKLRATLRELDSLDDISGFPIQSTGIEVYSVHAFGGDAEVNASLMANGMLVTGWPGAAHKIDGRWLVARDTVCAILLEWTPVRCPGDPKKIPYRQHEVASTVASGAHQVALTFPDGARAKLILPEEMSDGWKVRPYAELLLDDGPPITVSFQPGAVEAQQLVRTYEGPTGQREVELDARMGLVIDLGKWTGFVSRTYQFNDDGDEVLSERDRARVARHLTGYTSKDGFPVLTPSAPVRFAHDQVEAEGVQLAKSSFTGDPSRYPIELSWSNGSDIYVSVVLTPGPCSTRPPLELPNYSAIEQCTDDGFGRIGVEGNPDQVALLLDTLRVESYRPAPATVSV